MIGYITSEVTFLFSRNTIKTVGLMHAVAKMFLYISFIHSFIFGSMLKPLNTKIIKIV